MTKYPYFITAYNHETNKVHLAGTIKETSMFAALKKAQELLAIENNGVDLIASSVVRFTCCVEVDHRVNG